MKADLTRNSFYPSRYFSRVLMQQGRVQLDADWNEQADILLHYLRNLAADCIGPHGGPENNFGFGITLAGSDLNIGQGRYYVQGIPVDAGQGLTYAKQPNYPSPPTLPATPYPVYLDVWERLITCVEDDRIREVALGGADTAARTKVIWQVKAFTGTGQKGTEQKETEQKACIDVTGSLQPANRGWLQAVAKQQGTSTNPCVIDPNASYSGPENQLYRIEIHTPGPAGTATFKWSRENGCVVFPIVKLTPGSPTTAVLETLGRDDRFGLNEGDWVEVEDDDSVLMNTGALANSPAALLPGPLLQVQSISAGSLTVTLNGTPSAKVGQDSSKHPLLRRWDQTAGDQVEGGLQLNTTDNAAVLTEGTWFNIENGIQIYFQAAPADSTNQYRTGDYWLIPARTATGNIEWPTTTQSGKTVPVALPPDGVTHYYAPLGVVNADGSVTECRCQFKAQAQCPNTKVAT